MGHAVAVLDHVGGEQVELIISSDSDLVHTVAATLDLTWIRADAPVSGLQRHSR